MKKILRGVGGILLPIGRIKKGLGIGELKESYKSLGSSAKEMFSREKTKNIIPETYEEAVIRLELTPEMIESRKKNLFRTALFYLAIALALFIYTLKLLFTGVFLGTFIGLVLTLIALGLAYRDHFWFTQMKQKRLGLSLKDWFTYTFRGSKNVK